MATENAGSLRWTLEADDSSLVRSLNKASDSITDLSGELKRLEKNFSDTGDEAKRTAKNVSNIDSSSVKSLSTAVANCASNFVSMQSSVNNLAGALAQVKSSGANLFSDITDSANVAVNAVSALATAIGGTISKYAREGIEGADFISSANAQLIGLTHSVEGANSALAQSVQYYKNNPFDRFSTISATKQLLTFGNSVDDIGELLTKVGNVALANGVGIDEMAARYAEATSQSRVMIGQLSELAQVAPGIWGALGKQIGKSAGEARDAISGVGIDVETVKKAFDSLVEDKAMDAFEKTLARQTNRVKGRMSDIAAAIAGYQTDAQSGFQALDNGLYMSVVNLEKKFADILASSTDAGQRLRKALGRIGEAIAPVIDKLTENLPQIIDTVINLIEKLADVIEKVSKAITDSGTDWKAFIPIVGLLGSQLLGFVSTITGGGGAAGGILGAIGQLGSGVKQLNIPMLVFGGTLVKQMATNAKFRKSVEKLFSALGGLAERLFDVLAQMADSEATTKILQALVDVLTVLADTITKLPTPVLEAFIYAMIAGSTIKKLGDFAGSIINVGASLKDTADKVKNFGKSFADLGKAGFGKLFGGGEESSKTGGVVDEVGSMVDGLGEASTSLTKGQNMMKTIQMGIGNIILMAGAIAAMGKALEIAYNSIPDDLAGLSAKLGVVAGVVTAMGGLAALGGKLEVSQTSILQEAEIAGVVVALAVALGLANSQIPDDLGVLIPKLGVMAGVVVALGGLAAAVGQFEMGDKIKEGLLAMAGVAGVVAALGVALGVANAMIPDDIMIIIPKLGVMAGVVVAFGGLGFAIGKIEGLLGGMKKGLITMCGIAGVVVLLALAMDQLNKKVSSDIGKTAEKIASIAVVVGAFTGLSAAIGAIVASGVGAFLLGSGMASMLAIAGTVAALANAIAELDKKVPNNISGVKNKVNMLADVVRCIATANLGGILKAVGNVISTGSVVKIVRDYITLASELNVLQTININEDAAREKIDTLARVVNYVSGKSGSGIISAIQGVNNAAGAFKTEGVNKIVSEYVKLASMLMRLQTAILVPDLIYQNLTILMSVVRVITSRSGGGFGLIFGMLDDFANIVDTRSAVVIVKDYTDIASNLKKIQGIKLDKDGVVKKVNMLYDIVKKITDSGSGSWFEALGRGIESFEETGIVANADKIVKQYNDIATKLSKLKEMKLDKDGIQNAVNLIYDIVKKITDTGKGGWVEAMDRAVEAFFAGGIANKASQIVGVYSDIANKLNDVQKACSTLDADGINASIGNLKYIIKRVTDTGKDSVFGNLDLAVESDVAGRVSQNAKTIVDLYNDIANKLNEIQTACSKIDPNTVNGNIGTLKAIVKRVTDLGVDSPLGIFLYGWSSDTAVNVTNNAYSILQTYTKMIDPLNKIGGLELKDKEINDKVDALRKVVESVAGTKDPDGGVIGAVKAFIAGGMIDTDSADKIVKIVNSFSKIAKAANNMEGQGPQNWTEKIPAVQKVINAINGINADSKKASELAATAKTIAGMGSSLNNAIKMINGLDTVDKGKTDIVKDIRNFINEVFKINDDVPKLANIQNVVWRVQDLCNNITKDTSAINNLPGVDLRDALAKVSDIRAVIQACFGINDDAAKMSSIQNVVWRMQDLTNNMTKAINAFNGLPDVHYDDAVKKVRDIRGVIQECYGINGDAGRMSSIQNVVWRMRDLTGNMSAAITDFNKLPGVNGDDKDKVNKLKDVIDATFRINGNAGLMSSIQNVVWRMIDLAGNAKTAVDSINKISSLKQESVDALWQLKGVIDGVMKISGNASQMSEVQKVVSGAGSAIDSMKDVASKLTNVDVGDWQSGLTALTNVVNGVINTYVKNMSAGLSQVQAVGAQVGTAFAAGVNSSLATVAAAGRNTQGAYWGAIQGKIPDEFKQGAWMVQQFAAGLTTKFGDVAKAGRDTQGAYWNALQGKIADEYGQGGWLVQNVINGIRSKFGALGQAGRDTQGAYWNGLQGKMGDEYGQGSWMAQQVLNGINSHSGEFWNAGRNAIVGFKNGASSMNVYSTGYNIAQSFLNGLKKGGKQGSPWKTTIESGRFAVQGLIEGLEAESGRLENEAETLAHSVVDAFDGADISITPQIEGVRGNVPSVYSATPTVMAEDGSNYQAGIVINQTNNNYTDYSVRKMNRDLRWQLSIA